MGFWVGLACGGAIAVVVALAAAALAWQHRSMIETLLEQQGELLDRIQAPERAPYGQPLPWEEPQPEKEVDVLTDSSGLIRSFEPFDPTENAE